MIGTGPAYGLWDVVILNVVVFVVFAFSFARPTTTALLIVIVVWMCQALMVPGHAQEK